MAVPSLLTPRGNDKYFRILVCDAGKDVELYSDQVPAGTEQLTNIDQIEALIIKSQEDETAKGSNGKYIYEIGKCKKEVLSKLESDAEDEEDNYGVSTSSSKKSIFNADVIGFGADGTGVILTQYLQGDANYLFCEGLDGQSRSIILLGTNNSTVIVCKMHKFDALPDSTGGSKEMIQLVAERSGGTISELRQRKNLPQSA